MTQPIQLHYINVKYLYKSQGMFHLQDVTGFSMHHNYNYKDVSVLCHNWNNNNNDHGFL